MNATQNFHPVDARHVDIAKQDIDVTFLELAQCRFPVGRSLYTVPQTFQFFLQHQPQIGFIFCDQNSGCSLFAQAWASPSLFIAGSEIVNVVPTPGVDCTSRWPSCSVKIP